jgi:hypothetical protein
VICVPGLTVINCGVAVAGGVASTLNKVKGTHCSEGGGTKLSLLISGVSCSVAEGGGRGRSSEAIHLRSPSRPLPYHCGEFLLPPPPSFF